MVLLLLLLFSGSLQGGNSSTENIPGMLATELLDLFTIHKIYLFPPKTPKCVLQMKLLYKSGDKEVLQIIRLKAQTPPGSQVYCFGMKKALPLWKPRSQKASHLISILHIHTRNFASRLSVRAVTVLNCACISLESCYSLERRMHFIGLNGAYLRVGFNGCLLKEADDLKSQPSTFLGMQTSKRIWPRTPCGLIVGGVRKWTRFSLCSSCKDPTSLPS